MVGIRRVLFAMIGTMLAAATGAALLAPVAVAAPSPEYKLSWSRNQVADIRQGIARGDLACGVGNIAAGAGVSVVAGAGPAGLVAGAVVGAAGLLCGHDEQPLRSAVDEAYYKGCGVDAYFTDGPLSYDTDYRYVVCP